MLEKYIDKQNLEKLIADEIESLRRSIEECRRFVLEHKDVLPVTARKK